MPKDKALVHPRSTQLDIERYLRFGAKVGPGISANVGVAVVGLGDEAGTGA